MFPARAAHRRLRRRPKEGKRTLRRRHQKETFYKKQQRGRVSKAEGKFTVLGAWRFVHEVF